MAPLTTVLTPTTLAKERTIKEGYIVDESDRAKVRHNEFSDDISVISLAGIEDEQRREEIVKKIEEASKEWGIFQVVDHGVDTQLISQMTQLAKHFFALPDEQKLQLQMSPGNKGGFLISSHLQGEVVANWRELFVFFTYPINTRDYSRWPDKPEEWRTVVEAYAEKLMDLSLTMLELVSEGLGLEREMLPDSLGEITQHLVVNHYPKCLQPELVMGLRRHTDPCSLTILLQDHIGGLQVTKDDGKTWITVRPVQNAFVVNLGSHIYHLSNGRLKSADHRAIVNSEETRMSTAVFTIPHQEAKVYPLKLEEGEKPLLEGPVTYAQLNRSHNTKYVDIARLKKLVKEENWSQEEIDRKLSQLS